MSQTAGVSPVGITLTMSIASGVATVTATYGLVDPVTLTNLRATLLLYEDNVYYNGFCWQHVTRKIYDQDITLINQRDEVVVSTDVPIGDWNPAELHLVPSHDP